MISLKRLDHLGLRVTDFGRAVTFYRQFGFEMIRQDLNEHVVVLRHASGMEINLLDSAVHQQKPHNVLMDVPVRYAGYTHMALQVSDISRAANELEALGITITEGPVTFGDGKTSIFFRDPDRNVIELTQHAPVQVTPAGAEQEVRS